jgi:hypothetical protein
MKEIKKIEPLSLGKLTAALMLFLVLIVGVIFILIGLCAFVFSAKIGLIMLGMGFGIAIIGGIFYGIVGLIMGLLYGVIYNILAKYLGGIKMEIN